MPLWHQEALLDGQVGTKQLHHGQLPCKHSQKKQVQYVQQNYKLNQPGDSVH